MLFQTPPPKTAKHPAGERTGIYEGRTKFNQEQARIINDGIYWMEVEKWSQKPDVEVDETVRKRSHKFRLMNLSLLFRTKKLNSSLKLNLTRKREKMLRLTRRSQRIRRLRNLSQHPKTRVHRVRRPERLVKTHNSHPDFSHSLTKRKKLARLQEKRKLLTYSLER